MFRDQSDARWNRKRWPANRSRDQPRLYTKQRAGRFSSTRNLQYSLWISLKKLFFDHKPTPVTWFRLFKTKLPNRPKSECKLWKFTTVKVGVIGEGFLATKKKRIENHQSQPTSMTFWTVRETNTEKHRLWLAHFFLLSDALSSCVWFCLLD